YRKDLFLEAGLDPERPPQNWEEYLEYTRKLTNPERGIYGTGIGEGLEASYYLFPYLCSAGANAVKQQPDGDWRATFDTPGAVDAFYFFNKLLTTPWKFQGRTLRGFSYKGNDIWGKWGDGKIGMMMTDLLDKQLANVNL